MEPDLAQRSVRSSIYSVLSQGFQVIILFSRSIILARLLAPEAFGLYTFSLAIIKISEPISTFGFGSAFINQTTESNDPKAPGVYLTLISITTTLWGLLIITGSLFFVSQERQIILWILVGITFISHLTEPAQAILTKNVDHRRLALLNLIIAILSIVIAPLMAYAGYEVWSLISIDLIRVGVLIIGLYVISPVWTPKPAWSKRIANYFFQLGSKVLGAGILVQAIDRMDDLWTGMFLGDLALGFYSRAYTFANYPRRILALPLISVAQGTFAEAKFQRKRLSQAFFRVNALLVRSSFLLAGILLIIAPDFVRIVLGEKWLPMLDAFRLMIIYTMVDPIRASAGQLFISIGKPVILIRTRAIQIAILLLGLFTFGANFGIQGVAATVTIVAFVGLLTVFWLARPYVDFSALKLFGRPLLAFAISSGVTRIFFLISPTFIEFMSIPGLVLFSGIYILILYFSERHEIKQQLLIVLKTLKINDNRNLI